MRFILHGLWFYGVDFFKYWCCIFSVGYSGIIFPQIWGIFQSQKQKNRLEFTKQPIQNSHWSHTLSPLPRWWVPNSHFDMSKTQNSIKIVCSLPAASILSICWSLNGVIFYWAVLVSRISGFVLLSGRNILKIGWHKVIKNAYFGLSVYRKVDEKSSNLRSLDDNPLGK